MATKAKTISARAIAIAAVGSLALGGAQVVSPAGSVLAAGAGTAVAQETNPDKPGVTTGDVKFEGFFDGDNNRVNGPFDRSMREGDGYTVKYTVNFGNALPGDVLHFGPSNDFTEPINGKEITGSKHAGVRVYATTEPANIEVGGVVIGTYAMEKSGGITVRFNENAANQKDGSLTINAPVMVWEQYVSPPNDWDGKAMHADMVAKTYSQVNAYRAATKEWQKDRTFVANTTTRANVSPSQRDIMRSFTLGALRVDPSSFVTKVPYFITELPAGKGGTVEIAVDPNRPKSLQWTLEEDLPYRVSFKQYAKDSADDPYKELERSISAEEAKEKFPNLTWNVTRSGDMFKATFNNVPEGVKAYIRFDTSGLSGVGTYTPGMLPYVSMKLTDQDGEVLERSSSLGTVPNIPELGEATGSSFVRTGDLTGSIAGQRAGLGVDGSVAPIGGTKQTFTFFVKNTGEAYMAAPLVTLPNGKKKAVENFKVAPGSTGSFDVDYDVPAGNGALNFDVALSGATLSPSNTVSFRYSNASLSDSVKDSFGYPQDKPVTVEQDKTAKSPAPKGAPKDTKYRIDRTANPNLTWATVDPNTGVVTLSPSANVVPGNYEVPVEATFPDGSKRTITLPVVVTGEDPADRVKGLEDQVASLEKQLADEKAKSNADREKIAKLEAELKAAKDALKVAQDAAKAAQDSANNAQETANQALADLAKERERVDDLTKRADKAEKDLKDARERVAALEKENADQQKQIDQARKDVKDLQGKTKQLRTDLEAAKKRVTALEEQNKKQQGQIDALVKENKTQQSQIDALKKQNGEQQKQIDGLKAGLRDANKKITALETDLALTKIELAEVSGRLAEVEDRLNTGLGKCVGTIGGSLAALVPAVILASQFTGGTNIPQVDNSIAQFQRQLGMFNPQLAQVVDQNRGAIAAGLAGLGLLSLVLLPGTCGDASLGGAVMEPLSSARAERKAARENGEGGSSLKAGADVAAGEGAGSSEQ